MRRLPQQLVSLPEGPGPIYLKLYHKIRSLILTGAWPAGTRLPSSRRIAEDLGISRNTAFLAIDQLMSDGWIFARAGSGIYVSSEAPPARPIPSRSAADAEPDVEDPGPVPFQITPGALDLFPVAQWARLQSKVWSKASQSALNEGSGGGWFPLRSAIASHLYAVRGLTCAPEQVLVLPSSQSAVNLALRALSQAGDEMWIEDPGYPFARQAIGSAGLIECDIPVDASGIRVDVGIGRSPGSRLAYVTPACQFPTGAVMSESRRQELLDWATRRQSYIIEDDWDYNACFHFNRPPEPLAARLPDRVLFIHSFNRVMFAGLRITALVAPLELVSVLIEARQGMDGFTNVANQIALAEFITRGHLASHLRASRVAHVERRAALHRAISAHLGDYIRIDPLQAGLHTVAYTSGLPDGPMAAQARRCGLACSAMSDYMSDLGESEPALLLGFAGHPPESLTRATESLGACLAEFMAGRE
jgi:GntR family transcriptional regulator / MocR family aminotransferase